MGYVRETYGLEQDSYSYAYLSVLRLACDKNTSNAVYYSPSLPTALIQVTTDA